MSLGKAMDSLHTIWHELFVFYMGLKLTSLSQQPSPNTWNIFLSVMGNMDFNIMALHRLKLSELVWLESFSCCSPGIFLWLGFWNLPGGSNSILLETKFDINNWASEGSSQYLLARDYLHRWGKVLRTHLAQLSIPCAAQNNKEESSKPVEWHVQET